MSRVPYTIEISRDAGIRAKALTLRARVFRDGKSDEDRFDADAYHGVILDESSHIECCFRLNIFDSDGAAQSGYTGQFYDLTPLSNCHGPVVELGRLARHPDKTNPDILRVAFAAIADFVVSHNAQALFGCTSFQGLSPSPYNACFSCLAHSHLLPDGQRPVPRSCRSFPLTDVPFDHAQALRSMPPLLRSYLRLGGRTSRAAVIDPDLQTIHVYTRLNIANVANARRKTLLNRV